MAALLLTHLLRSILLYVFLVVSGAAPAGGAETCLLSPSSLTSKSISSPWQLSRFASLVTFGDSYTDESRLAYFIRHNGSGPPPGSLMPLADCPTPEIRNWARYLANYSGPSTVLVDQTGTWHGDESQAANPTKLKLFNYAVSGAVCSNEITPRHFAEINAPFPSLLEYEIPAFLTDLHAKTPNTSHLLFHAPLSPHSTIYALFIGTNDLGNIAFLTDSQLPGKALRDYTSCIFTSLDALYAAGARHFLLLNTIPLHLAPQYAPPTLSGATQTRYFPDKSHYNATALAAHLHQLTTSANEILKFQTPYELLIARRYPGAHLALFDTWAFFSAVYRDPARYLDRSSGPVSVTDWSHCWDLGEEACARRREGRSEDSFMWWDELHPSEQVHRVMAREIVEVLQGKSQYATYWAG